LFALGEGSHAEPQRGRAHRENNKSINREDAKVAKRKKEKKRESNHGRHGKTDKTLF
jgi:hypothetical protein